MQAKELNNRSKTRRQHIVFFTGAGVSTESGLNTFRGKNGLWTQEGFQYLASTACLLKETQKSLDFYNWRRKQLTEVEPNDAHRLIASLEERYDVTVITQNVDNLHERAGSSNVLHLHGELAKVCSTANRYDPKYVSDYPLDQPIVLGQDAGDGSQLRPYIVMFGECVDNMNVAEDIVRTADIFVIVGTSLSVYPAAGLVNCTRKDAIRFVIDPNETGMSIPDGFSHIQSKATIGMLQLVEQLSIWEAEEIAGVKLKGQGVTPEKAILGDLLRIIHIEQLSREFFGESFTWLHQKLNGIDRQGNPVPPLSPSERATLQMAMKEISKRIMDKAEKLNELN